MIDGINTFVYRFSLQSCILNSSLNSEFRIVPIRAEDDVQMVCDAAIKHFQTTATTTRLSMVVLHASGIECNQLFSNISKECIMINMSNINQFHPFSLLIDTQSIT